MNGLFFMEVSADASSRLAGHLRDHPLADYLLGFGARHQEEHLKGLTCEALDDERRIRIFGRTLWNFGSDSFLGLDRDPRLMKALCDGARRWGTHNGSSRAFCSVSVCEEVERRLARWLAVEDTLLFPSVTLANLGLIPAITNPGDDLLVERMAHNSVQQGALLAAAGGARLERIPECAPEALAQRLERSAGRSFVLALDGVNSMTGIVPPLRELDRLVRAHGGILYVDDAHGTGVLGERGRGATYAALGSLRGTLCVGSLSKAFSCMGAFVTCTTEEKLLLQLRANTYAYGGPIPPPYLEALLTVCDILDSTEYERLLGRLRARIEHFSRGVESLGIALLGKDAPILSIPIGEPTAALKAGRWLFDRGYYVQSSIFPAVPLMGSLLRIQINANHSLEAIDGLLGALADLRKIVPISSGHRNGCANGHHPVQKGESRNGSRTLAPLTRVSRDG